MKIRNLVAGVCTIAAMLQSQITFAQSVNPPCIKQADLTDAVIYSMPSMVTAFDSKCSTALGTNAARKASNLAFARQFVVLQDKAWPGAQRALMQLTKSGNDKPGTGDELANMIQNLPGKTMRPFVDAIVQQKVAEMIPSDKCSQIDRGITLLSPLPPENIGGLVTFILEIAETKKPSLCPVKRP